MCSLQSSIFCHKANTCIYPHPSLPIYRYQIKTLTTTMVVQLSLNLFIIHVFITVQNKNKCQVWLKLALWFFRRFLKFNKVYLLFHYYLLLKKGMAFHSNKHESSSPKDSLCQVWLKLALWFLRRFLKFAISLLSPLRKGHGLSFKQTRILITQECFVPSFVEIGPGVLKKKMKM